jgi:transposase-like protein
MFLFDPGTPKEGGMARIRKDDHARILHLVDVERRAVREIAAEYGCTAANIYSLLAKLRRSGGEGSAGAGHAVEDAADETVPATLGLAAPGPAAPEQAALGLDPQPVMPEPVIEAPVLAPVDPLPEKPVAAKLAIVPSVPRADAPRMDMARPAAETDAAPEARRALGARLSKPGMGLVMRTEDGEETMTPFRSIDDLLSAIKPILRANARSADPVWFSLQPVDLSAIDMDAA